MKKVYFALFVIFTVLTFAGAGYVLYHHGQQSAGYACIPMVFALVFNLLFQRENKK